MTVKENVLKNYNDEVASAVTKLSEKGFIYVNGTGTEGKTDYIIKYNVFSNDFETVDYGTFEDLVLNLVPNYWNIEHEGLKYIILNQCSKNLAAIEENTVENYFKYIEAKENVDNVTDFKKELKSLLKECKSKHGKLKTSNYYAAAEVHVQVLANNDVVYDSIARKYYKYSKEDDKFINLNPTTLLNILREDSAFSKPNIILVSDVSLYMNMEYKRYLVNSTLPAMYNLNKNHENILNNNKKDFETLDKILKHFK